MRKKKLFWEDKAHRPYFLVVICDIYNLLIEFIAYNNLPLARMLSTARLLALLTILICSVQALPSLKCLTYLLDLKTLFEINKGLCTFCVIQSWRKWRPFWYFPENRQTIWAFPKCAATTVWSTRQWSLTRTLRINMCLNIPISCSVFIMDFASRKYAQWTIWMREGVSLW